MNQAFSKIWIVVILFVIFGGILAYFNFFAPSVHLAPCITDFDCYLRLPLKYFLKGYSVQCINDKCIIIWPGELQPIGK